MTPLYVFLLLCATSMAAWWDGRGRKNCQGMVCPAGTECSRMSYILSGIQVTNKFCTDIHGDVIQEEEEVVDLDGDKTCVTFKRRIGGKMNVTKTCRDGDGEPRPWTPEDEEWISRGRISGMDSWGHGWGWTWGWGRGLKSNDRQRDRRLAEQSRETDRRIAEQNRALYWRLDKEQREREADLRARDRMMEESLRQKELQWKAEEREREERLRAQERQWQAEEREREARLRDIDRRLEAEQRARERDYADRERALHARLAYIG